MTKKPHAVFCFYFIFHFKLSHREIITVTDRGTIDGGIRIIRVSITTRDNRIPTTDNRRQGGTAETPWTKIKIATITIGVRRQLAIIEFWATTVSET